MSINCEAEDCWFDGNLDRLNEYDDAEYICNAGTIDELGHDIATQTDPPVMFTLCHACWANCRLRKQGTCSECGRTMLDAGIQWSGNWFCRYCLDEEDIVHLINYGNAKDCACLGIPKSSGPLHSCDENPRDLSWEDYRDRTNPELSELLEIGLAWRKHRRAKFHVRKRKRKEKVAQELTKLVPGLSEDTGMEVVKRLKLDKAPETVKELVEKLVYE